MECEENLTSSAVVDFAKGSITTASSPDINQEKGIERQSNMFSSPECKQDTKGTNETKSSCVTLYAELRTQAVVERKRNAQIAGEVKTQRKAAFTLAEGATHVAKSDNQRKVAFTLAEVLITLGIIGVVAALTLPTLLQNIQDRVRREQVRTVKYKLTQATDKMKSLDLIGPNLTTMQFVNELKNHLKIAKICDNNNLTGCWTTDKINTVDGEVSVSSLRTGEQLGSISPGSKNTETVGIVTGDGVPMILTFSPKCMAMDSSKTYTWSMNSDNKPETNATTNCVSAVFDINGSNKPNKVGQDVRTLNSLLGSKDLGTSYSAIAQADQNDKLKQQLGLTWLFAENRADYYAGAKKACYDIGLSLPTPQTLANIAGAQWGRTDVEVNTYLLPTTNSYCTVQSRWTDSRPLICATYSTSDIPSSVSSLTGNFWASAEMSSSLAYFRDVVSHVSSPYGRYRGSGGMALCVGD